MRKSDRTKACQPMFVSVDSPLLRLTEIGERLVAGDEWSLWLVDLPIDKNTFRISCNAGALVKSQLTTKLKPTSWNPC